MFRLGRHFDGRTLSLTASLLLVILILTLTLVVVNAQPQDLRLREAVQEYTLENGLKVLMLRRERSPTISFQVAFC
ncbi:MAG: hypothetical protein ACE5JP_11015 [Candidatus Bipolaricaulia bacterium]